ncbi:leucine-rich repeat-containing protein 34 [Plutella xylostella]|uniref:leucine-rich repeat-containing protein 34 n=1 Tax=Plutella xylostella TaxID=51655 RepID=UPI002032DAC5|nr:leucine-rich repeat-containing protein 34 [Plutella xylostella]
MSVCAATCKKLNRPPPRLFPRKKQKRCICDPIAQVKKITGQPEPLPVTEINQIRLSLFTERNSDGTRYLVLRGRDLEAKYHQRIKDTDIKAICLYIRECPQRITKLDLCYNQITDAGFFKLLKKLLVKSRSSINNLNIMNNKLTELSMEYLARYAYYVNLKYLRVNGNPIGTKGGEYFADFLRINKTLEYADVGQSGQTLASVAAIASALHIDHGANTTLKVFDLSRVDPLFNRYNLESKWLAYHMELLLVNNSSIVELHLQKNELIGHDMEFLVRGLRQNSTLLYLDLGYNRIGEYGAEQLGSYLAEKPELLLLNLAGNGIKDTGARALSFGLPFSKVRALDISANKITDTGLMDLLYTIKKPYYMRFLNIWGNKFGAETCGLIQRMLDSCALFQHTLDVKIYEVDGILYAAYYPNPADRNKHLYYCELEYATAQPIYHIKRNVIAEKKSFKVDCKHRKKLDKTSRNALTDYYTF